jgi:predicted ArsR family transcriptional regulator
MTEKEQRFRRRQCDRLGRYLELREEVGEMEAFEAVLEGYPEQQRRLMGPYIETRSLADGFREVRDLFVELGIREEIVDVSRPGEDAAIEVLTVCMCRNACEDIGLDDPSPLLCELDFEATRRAFPGMTVDVHHRMVEGAFACVFRYSRPAAA